MKNKGIVRWLSKNEGFGFIREEGGRYDVFFNLCLISHSPGKDFKIGDQVLFEINKEVNGLSAKNVMKI